MMTLATNNGAQAATFIRRQVDTNSNDWYRLCLKLQRMSRGLPAVYPTALSAANATPRSERVYDQDKWKRGMVGYCYDPRIPGTAGHIFFIAGRKDGQIITGTNDAKQAGFVDYVPLRFYKERWGHTIQFAATWLNGYDFADFNAPAKPVNPGTLGEQYKAALDSLKKVRARKRKKHGNNHPLVLALNNDINHMQATYNLWKASSKK